MYEILARGAQLLLALAGAYVVALWFVLVIWTFRDIEGRSRSVVTQVAATLLSVLFFVPGVLLYLILRPKETLDGTFQRSLEEEYLLQDLEELPLCQRCHRYVEDDFILCPHCHVQLREPCPTCSRHVDLRWALCPYCGAVQSGKTAETVEPIETPAARWTSPAIRRRGRSMPARPGEMPVVKPDAVPTVVDEPATESADRRPAALAAPLTLVPGVRHLLRPTDRFRARSDDPAMLDLVAPATDDGTIPAADGARDLAATRDDGLPLGTERFRARVNGNGTYRNGTANGHADADLSLDGREPRPALPEESGDETGDASADELVLARTRRDRD